MQRNVPIFDGAKWAGQFFSIHDALQDRPPTEYLVENILPAASLTIVYGAPGTFKTNLVMDLVMCCALERPWLSSDTFDGFITRPVSTLWVDQDTGPDLLHERFAASARGLWDHPDDAAKITLQYASHLDPPFNGSEDAPVHEIIKRAEAMGARIIVFDNLGTISGGLQENSSDMQLVTNRLRLIAVKTKAAVITIHHSAKNTENGVRSSRGHGSIDAAVDNAFYIEAAENALTLYQTKARRHKLPPFAALFEFEHRPGTKDFQTMKFIGVEPDLPPSYLKAKTFLLTHLANAKETTQSELIDALVGTKLAKHKARAILQTFEQAGFLKVQQGAHYRKLYSLGNVDAKISLLG